MRNLNLLSGLGVAIVGAWLAVTSLAHAAEFSCTIPWYTDTDCKLPKFSIPPEGKLRIEVYTVKKDGRDFSTPCPVFQIFDVNNDNRLVHTTEICAGAAETYQNPKKTTEQIVYLRVDIGEKSDIDITGRYTVTK